MRRSARPPHQLSAGLFILTTIIEQARGFRECICIPGGDIISHIGGWICDIDGGFGGITGCIWKSNISIYSYSWSIVRLQDISDGPCISYSYSWRNSIREDVIGQDIRIPFLGMISFSFSGISHSCDL